MKVLYEKYGHALPVMIYGIIYMLCFGILENRGNVRYMIIHMNIDDYIPFCEVFIVPYLLWFLYIPAVLLYLFFKDREGYWKYALTLCIGMTVFIMVSALIPNAHHLRLRQFPRENIFTQLIAVLWKTDTPTNLFPSIHTYNSLAAHFAVMHQKKLSKIKCIRYGSLALCLSIICSTVFLKQHSMFDVITAFILAAGAYAMVYSYDIIAVCKRNARLRAYRKSGKRARLG